MRPPKTQNGPGGVAAPTRAENDQKAAEDIVRVPRQRGSRHVTGQTPYARFMLVHENRPGRRTADAIPLDHCPVCGFQSKHSTAWPPPEFLTKCCTACGFQDKFATIAIPAHRRRKVA
ncbi:hypothetical protein ACGFI3_42780 [Nonomuraea wenchangensis]|uniref:hypothetical protein n=1 Tax=Nonomuraea wenchangensis TaxID=568860 RepID=UPI00371B5010